MVEGKCLEDRDITSEERQGILTAVASKLGSKPGQEPEER